MRKSSEKKFYEIINTSGCDNSMGDMNYLPFAFIDEMNLQNEFEDYLIKAFGWRAATQGYFDGACCIPHDKRWKKIPELFKHYHEAYLAGKRNR